MKKLTENDMKNPLWKLVCKIRGWKFKFKSIRQQTKWLTYEQDGKKYLVIVYLNFGKTIWSKHFIIEAVATDKGILNDRYDKSMQDWFKPCTTVCDHISDK